MDSLLLGLAAPSIAATAGAVSRAVTAVAKPLTSSFASFLQAETQPEATADPQTASFEDLRVRADALQADVEQRINQLIADSGVQLGSEVRLRVSEFDGTLEADSVASPDREILEAALASDPTLADDFRELAAVRKIIVADGGPGQFSADHGNDPRQTLAAFGTRFDDRFEAVLHLASAENFSSSKNTVRLEFE